MQDSTTPLIDDIAEMVSSFHDDSLQDYSEAELAHYIRTSPRLTVTSSVFRLSPTLLAKYYRPSLLEDMLKVTELACQLGIRVPYIKRVITYGGDSYCIMECISRNTLEKVWMELGWVTTIKLALQLRRYIKLLRSAKSSTAGSVATGECRSFWLEDRYGLPSNSSAECIASFIQFWANFTSIRKVITEETQTTVDIGIRPSLIEKAFVLTHHDLAPRNLILDSSNQLWLLDWDYAGFYPIYFEYASMQNFYIPTDWNRFGTLRWTLFSWIAVGRYQQEARVLEQIRSKFTRFAAGRRFELLKRGGPSRRPVS